MTPSEPVRPPGVTDPDALADRLWNEPGLLVGLDFDGTLAPIVADPAAARLDPAVRAPIAGLAAREDVRVAVLSGRALADLVDRVGVDGVVYAGNHGLEVRRDGIREVAPAADDHRPAVAAARERLAETVGDVPGCVVEDKRLTVTVHVRETPAGRVAEVADAVDAVAGDADDLAVTEGKQVFEVRPAVDRDKGTAIRSFAERTPADWTTVYLGDDTTDEDAFRAIQPEGVGVHVGEGETAADFRLSDRADVGPLLCWLALSVPRSEREPTGS